jgi:predicted DNA binding CopG/RHH family protein
MAEKYLDREEQDLMEAFESIEIEKVAAPTEIEQQEIKAAARDFVKKETKMNIRIDAFELEKIKEYADNEGLKYQSFVKSVLHKYITGQLVEKRNIS